MQSALEQQEVCMCACSPLPVLTVYGWLHVCLWGPAAAACCGCWWAPVSAAQTWSILQEWDIKHSLHQLHHNLIRFTIRPQSALSHHRWCSCPVQRDYRDVLGLQNIPTAFTPEDWQEQCFLPKLVIHTYDKPCTIWKLYKSCFHATPTLQKVSLNTTGPSPAAGFLLRSCPLCSDLHVVRQFLLQGTDTTRVTGTTFFL